MKPQIIIMVNFKDWSFEVYKADGTVKVNVPDCGKELSSTEWLSLAATVNVAVETAKNWRS